jgi:hypothetical protein
MQTDIVSCVLDAWACAKANDLPNWFALAFTVVLVPLVLVLWQHRKVPGIPGPDVHFSAGNIKFSGATHDAVDIEFTNHTGAVVYVSGARIRSCTKKFSVPIEASRDVTGNSYRLKFMNDHGNFVMREITLQTSETRRTSMPASRAMPPDFFAYSAPWWARLVRYRQYFVLEYTAMVGTTRCSVRTLY